MDLQNELRHALDVLIVEHENVEMGSSSNVTSIMAYEEVGESRVFQITLVSRLIHGNPILSEDYSIQIKASILHMKPTLMTAGNHDTMLNIGCDCGVCLHTQS